MQDNDPNHMHQSGWEIYIFLVVAPVLVVLVIYAGAKLMNWLENRKNRSYDGSTKTKD